MISLDAQALAERRTTHAILDVRDEPSFAAGHLPGSGNLPLGELEARRAELPPRQAPVLVVAGSPQQAREAASALEDLGYSRVACLEAPLAALPDGLAARGPGERLWRPAPFLEQVLSELSRGRALDVAAGSGREAVFLALHGFDVEAWDRAPEALARAQALAGRHRTRIGTVVADLERRDATLPVGRFALVVCFRFLHRPLFPAMAAALEPGGHLVYETYLAGQERFGRPTHARFLLRPGELAHSFPGLEVLRSEELTPEEGPFTARLWARRPPAAAGRG